MNDFTDEENVMMKLTAGDQMQQIVEDLRFPKSSVAKESFKKWIRVDNSAYAPSLWPTVFATPSPFGFEFVTGLSVGIVAVFRGANPTKGSPTHYSAVVMGQDAPLVNHPWMGLPQYFATVFDTKDEANAFADSIITFDAALIARSHAVGKKQSETYQWVNFGMN